MSFPKLDAQERAYRIGRRELARHRPDRALAPLRAATADCPADLRGKLATRLFWLAVALSRLDRIELALKSLASAQKLRPRGLIRKTYENRANAYGMIRRTSPELDDFYAFYSIQICRYLAKSPGQRFGTATEKDVITHQIAETWAEIRKTGRLAEMSQGSKLELFESIMVRYPSLFGSFRQSEDNLGGASSCKELVRVDFKRGRLLKAGDRCPCGSGLPYCRCCGRTQSPSELLS
jgi:tetratricopeptide (TPR) repeat protein